MQNADGILIHSSRIILSQRDFIHRTIGHSLVCIRMLSSGIKLDCTLTRCLKWVIQQRPGWVLLTFLQRNNKTLVRPLDCSSLLHNAHRKAQGDIEGVQQFSEGESFCSIDVDYVGDNSVRAGPAHPPSQDFAAYDSAPPSWIYPALTPDSELVIMIPSEVQVTRTTVISTL